jgi:hypothetical protein
MCTPGRSEATPFSPCLGELVARAIRRSNRLGRTICCVCVSRLRHLKERESARARERERGSERGSEREREGASEREREGGKESLLDCFCSQTTRGMRDGLEQASKPCDT